ncbi:MAG: type II secretion system secretin GspD [Synergistaceae bacterium]|nr:type II secretion system secretin GspD [Synergistaceae bacterium]
MKKIWGSPVVFLLMAAFLLTFTQAVHAAAPNGGNGFNGSNGNASLEQDERALIELAQTMRRAGMVQFNFVDIDLAQFVRFMAELLQRNIIVPPAITGKISVISPKSSNLHEARQIFLSILQSQGWSLQDMGGYDKLVQGGLSFRRDVDKGKGGPGLGEEFVTYIVPLDYIVPDFVIQSLQQAFGQSLLVLPAGNGRDILLQGRATDVNRGADFIRELDVPASARTSRVFFLRFGDPVTVANQLNSIAQTGLHFRGLSAVPDPNSRQVVVVGEAKVIAEAAKIIESLDVDVRQGDFHIYKLQNIDATEAAEQLSKVLAASAAMQPTPEGKIPATVVPDLTTNSLIFAATQRQYDSLKKILEEIDVQPKQVLIRGFLAEVNVTNLNKAGIDWAILGGQIWDNLMLGGMGQIGEGSIPGQFLEWFNELSRKEEFIERNGSTYSITNYQPLALVYATIDLLKKYDAVNVLSMPRLMCTDNKESSFQVGQVIPVLKGTASDLSNPSALQQNYDYKDTGLTLTVTPHIRSGNVVALDIEQTTEDVLTAAGAVTPVTAKRQVKTSVVVEDGETIVLGGIVKETEKSLRRRVPGLSYIPLIGGLFQKVSKEREKIDFIIFLTPQIIRNTEQMREATNQAAFVPGVSGWNQAEMNPAEQEVDRRFRELYRKSSRKQY